MINRKNNAHQDNPANVSKVKKYLLDRQTALCEKFEDIESSQKFIKDNWQYQTGGGGTSCILEGGLIIEKGGVNFSHVKGNKLPKSATDRNAQLLDCCFEAMGISVVIHPVNPFVPTSHLNIRFFIATKPDGLKIWWFGGGYDLTPYYPFDEDCYHWHQTAFKACEPFGTNVYQKYKKWCDEYFYIKHRQENRGIGGLFFDDLNQWPFEKCFLFMQSVADSYNRAYLPIINRRKNTSWNERQKDFQCYRRGRYVEYNLLYDRGTLFGLQSGGRTESILMSLPPLAKWHYNWQATRGSPEEKLQQYLQPREWI